jgi:hypothetical protein
MEENPMRTGITFFGAVALVLAMGAAVPQFGQDAATASSDADGAKHSLAIKVLRAINTANWPTGQTTVPMLGGKIWQAAGNLRTWERACLPEIRHGLPTRIFPRGPEILPGWSLRLDVTDGGEGYDLLLEDTTDKTCGYAAATDERGLVRQSNRLPDLNST